MSREPRRPAELEWRVFRGTRAVAAGLITEHHLRSRSWMRIRQNVYADSRLDRDHALACRGTLMRMPPTAAVLAGPSAAYVHGVDFAAGPDDDVHVILTGDHRIANQAGTRLHRCRLDPPDITELDLPSPHPMAVTSPGRPLGAAPGPHTPVRSAGPPAAAPVPHTSNTQAPSLTTAPGRPTTDAPGRLPGTAREPHASDAPARPPGADPRPHTSDPAALPGETAAGVPAPAPSSPQFGTAARPQTSARPPGTVPGLPAPDAAGRPPETAPGPRTTETPAPGGGDGPDGGGPGETWLAGVFGGDRVAVTSPARTAWDVAVWVPLAEAVPIIDALLFRKIVTRAELDEIGARLADRPGGRRALHAFSLTDGRAETAAESALRMRIFLAGLPMAAARPQVGTCHPPLAWPVYRVALWCETRRDDPMEQLYEDAGMIRGVLDDGWTVLRVSRRRVERELPDVVRELRAALVGRGWRARRRTPSNLKQDSQESALAPNMR